MTREQWFEEPNRAIELGKLLRDPLVQLAMQVTENEGPAKRVSAWPDLLAKETAQLVLGQIQGFQKYPDIFMGLAELMPEHKVPKETYGATAED